jgi:capsular exopolysaccharide synthesis family protein
MGEVAALPTKRIGAVPVPATGARWSTSLFEESIDTLRTGLRLNAQLAEMQVLAVASAVRHEGKTSLATQLSVSFAKTSHGRVLLIDADMRIPDLHKIFDVANDRGLAQVLVGELDVEDAIVPVLDGTLDLLPAGELLRSPHQIAANGSVRSLIERLREKYEVILIDTPPVLAAGEALTFASAADATLICTMQNRSCRNQVLQAFEKLVLAGANPLGTVLNGVPMSRYAYAYAGYR